MKITLAVPKGKAYKKRLEKELATAVNIKSKQTRDSVIVGLKKILENYKDETAFLWDGNKLEIYHYPLNEFIYFCGKDFVAPGISVEGKYLLLTMDANEATIGLLHGKAITPIWSQDSNVPRKQDSGGQSQRRFERAREEALKQWMKKVACKIKDLCYN